MLSYQKIGGEMKRILFGLAIFLTHLAHAKGELLTYEYGNQITRSELRILLDGTIHRTEKRAGGAPAEIMPDVMLTPDVRKQLFFAIQAVVERTPDVIPGHDTTLGSSSGRLEAHSMLGSHLIRTIERGKPGEKDTVTYSKVPEARWIERLVFSLVENRMYRIELGE